MLKRFTLLAVGVAAVMALASPVLARAEGWTTEGAPLEVNGTLSKTGNWRFAASSGGMECLSKSMWTFNPGTTGTVDTFEPDGSATSHCSTTGGLKLLGCKIERVEATELPWTLHWKSTNGETGESRVTVTTGTTHIELVACSIHHVTFTPGSVDTVIAGPEMNAIMKGRLEGSLSADIESVGTQTATVSDEMEVVEGSGMFGL